MITAEEANKRVADGWIDTWVIFEAIAITETASKEALESLVDKLDKDGRVKVYKKSFGENKKIDNPIQGVDVGYSLTCEVNVVSKTLDNLANVVIEYGPSAVEILKPEKINLSCGEAQNILNSISNMMHRLASVGAGGIVFMKGDE
jgi:hypothetical protein